jgi:23S rRNA (guanosine2251-2'-O)-methyltransferase
LPPESAPALPPPEALAEDEELVAGRRPVEEAFVARRPARRLLVVPQRRAALEKIVLHATSLRIPIVEVEGGSLTSLAGFDGHQGVALVVEPRRYAGLADILARATERGEPPFVLVLDSLQDPHNVGSLLRSAEAAGVHGVIFPSTRQAPLSPSAVKASAGAVEHLLLAPVDDLPGALSDLHARGLRIAGADGDAPMTARQADLRGPLAIVVGSEGQGLGPTVRRRCDLFIRIPMRGAVGSLNAAVAGSILVFEAVSQRDLPERPPTGAGADQSVEAEGTPEEQPTEEPATAPARKPAPAKATPAPASPEAPASTAPTESTATANPEAAGTNATVAARPKAATTMGTARVKPEAGATDPTAKTKPEAATTAAKPKATATKATTLAKPKATATKATTLAKPKSATTKAASTKAATTKAATKAASAPKRAMTRARTKPAEVPAEPPSEPADDDLLPEPPATRARAVRKASSPPPDPDLA